MAIADEDVAVGSNADTGRPVEQVRPISPHAWYTDRHQHLAGGTYLQNLLANCNSLHVPGGDLLIVRVGGPEIAVLVDGEPVRVCEQSHPEASEKPACGIEFKDGRVGLAAIEARGVAGRLVVEAPVKHPDVAIAGDMHPDDLSPLVPVGALHARGKRRPIRDE